MTFTEIAKFVLDNSPIRCREMQSLAAQLEPLEMVVEPANRTSVKSHGLEKAVPVQQSPVISRDIVTRFSVDYADRATWFDQVVVLNVDNPNAS